MDTLTPGLSVDDKHETFVSHVEDTLSRDKYLGLSEVQKTLAVAADREKNTSFGTFDAIKYYWVAFLWSQYASFGTVLVGYDGSVAGAVISVPAFREVLGTEINGEYVISAAWQVGFNVGGLIASILASLFYPYLGDKLGRRGCLLFGCIVSIAAIFLEFFLIPGQNVMWFFGKFINGIAGSIFASTSSSYAIEVSPLKLRGVTTGVVNMYISVGQFLCALVIKGAGGRADRTAYQIPIAVQWLFSVVILLGIPFCPESPWILVKQGKIDQAKLSLKRLYGRTEDDLDMHLKVIQDTLEFEGRLHSSSRWVDLFRVSDKRRTLIVMLIYICQQVTGVQFALGFSTYFFELAGINTSDAFSLNVGSLSLALVSNMIGIILAGRTGRRFIFLLSTYACTIDCLLIGVCSLITNNPAATWAMASFTMLYMACFQLGLGPMTYTYTAEIGSARLRSRVIAWGNICNQFFSLIIQIINPYMINPDEGNLQGKVGWVFGGMSVFASGAAWYFLPETGGRTTDELDLMFKKAVPARQFKRYEITLEDRLDMDQVDERV